MFYNIIRLGSRLRFGPSPSAAKTLNTNGCKVFGHQFFFFIQGIVVINLTMFLSRDSFNDGGHEQIVAGGEGASMRW